MFGRNIVIADLTVEPARIAVISDAAQDLQAWVELTLPWRVAIREEEHGILALAGEEAAGVLEADQTLIFEDLSANLPSIEDEEVQSRLIGAFWESLCRTLYQRGLLDERRPANAYVIPPPLYPLSLLERFRAACANEERLKLAGFSQATLSLLLGFLQTEFFKEVIEGLDQSQPRTLCLIAASDSWNVEVACFDYSLDAGARSRLLIRDYFRTTCAEMSAKCQAAEVLSAFSILISLESPNLPAQALAELDAAFGAIAADAVERWRQTLDVSRLKILGAAHVARCSAGRGGAGREYMVENACHIGIRINQTHFHPIFAKEELARIDSFPHTSVKAFKLRGWPGNEMRIHLYCGYSNRVEESTLLGYSTLSRQEIARLSSNAASAVAAALRFDTPGSGELILGLLPEKKVIASMPFTLPGLVV